MDVQNQRIKAAQLYKFFGLYNQSTRVPIPLKKIQVNTKIEDYIAETTYSQVYQNEHDTVLETEYFFPISSEACFHNFRVKFGSVIIEGDVKEKEQARKQYDEHKEKGDLVAYAEITEESYSVMCVKIGNIPPQSEIEITFAYIERVQITLNKFWQFILSSSIIPHHNSSENKSLANYPIYAKEATSDFDIVKWDVAIAISSRSPITFLKSPSHEINVQNAHEGGVFSAKIALENSNKYAPTKDLVILYSTESVNKPSYLLSPYEQGYCTLINFFPQIGYLTFDDAYLASLEGRNINEGFINKSDNEFIFVIDRSEEMRPAQVRYAKQCLQIFLKEIPRDCYFNVIKLDKPNEPFFRESVLTSKENKEEILKNLDHLFDETGDSKIQAAFEYIGELPNLKDHPRVVIFLTRGVVREPLVQINQVIKNKLYKTRVFMLGLGDSSLTDFIIKASLEGYGSHEVVRNEEEIPEKVKHVLKSVTAPYFTDFELKIENESLFSYIIPLPKSIGCITPNELVEFFVIFNKKFEQAKETSFTLKFYNSFNQRVEEFSEKINIEFAEPSESVVKLGISKFCDSLEKKKEVYAALSSDIGEAFERDINQKLVATSVKYKILTSQTAFICKVKEGDDIIKQIPTQKITVSKTSIAVQPSQVAPPCQDEEADRSREHLTDEQYQMRKPLGVSKEDDDVYVKENMLDSLIRTIPSKHYDIGSQPLYEERGTEELKEQRREAAEEKVQKLEEIERKPRSRQVIIDEDHDASPRPVVDKGEGKIPTFGGKPGKEVSSSPKVSVDLTEELTTPRSDLNLGLGGTPRKEVMSPVEKFKYNQGIKKTGSQKFVPPRTASPFRQNSFENARTKMKTAASIPKDFEFGFSESALDKLFKLQAPEGYWEPVVSLSDILGQTIPNLLKQMPAELESLDEKTEVWLTIIILAWINLKCPQESESEKWKNNFQKAAKWLQRKGLDYKAFNSSTLTLFKL